MFAQQLKTLLLKFLYCLVKILLFLTEIDNFVFVFQIYEDLTTIKFNIYKYVHIANKT